MPSLKTTGNQYQSEFVLDDGRRVLGAIDQVADRQQPAFQFNNNRRLLRVRPGAEVAAGDVLVSPAGQRFLVAAGGASDISNETIYTSFRLFELDQQLLWERHLTIIDPLTRQLRSIGYENKGLVYCALEPLMEDDDRQMHVQQERYRCLSGADLAFNDKLGPYVVKRLSTLLGVKIAEVQ